MKRLKVINKKNNEVLSQDVMKAYSVKDRLIGLMFKKEISYDGLHLEPCNSIHTFFMKFPLDLVFLDKNLKVVKVLEGVKPWRMTRLYFSSSSVLEFKTGIVGEKVHKHDQLEVLCIN